MTPPKARAARTPLRGRGRSQRVTVPAVERQELEGALRRAASGGATAELEDALAAAVWLSPADLVAVGALGAILRTLEMVGGSTSRAAEILGISVRKIQYRLKEYATGGREARGPEDEVGELD